MIIGIRFISSTNYVTETLQMYKKLVAMQSLTKKRLLLLDE